MAEGDIDYGQVWRSVHEHLDAVGLPSQQRAFLQLASLRGMLEATALLAVPNDFTKDIIERNMRPHIIEALTTVLGPAAPDSPISIAVTVDPSMTGSELGFDTGPLPAPSDPTMPEGRDGRFEGRHDDVRTAVQTVLDDPAAADERARAGRALVEETYDWSALGERLWAVVADVIGR